MAREDRRVSIFFTWPTRNIIDIGNNVVIFHVEVSSRRRSFEQTSKFPRTVYVTIEKNLFLPRFVRVSIRFSHWWKRYDEMKVDLFFLRIILFFLYKAKLQVLIIRTSNVYIDGKFTSPSPLLLSLLLSSPNHQRRSHHNLRLRRWELLPKHNLRPKPRSSLAFSCFKGYHRRRFLQRFARPSLRSFPLSKTLWSSRLQALCR